VAIIYQKKLVLFQGAVSVEDAEGLLEWLIKNPKCRMDFSACQHLHAANLQVMMVIKPAIAVWPKDANLCAWLEAALK
jgi:hypothetical protein